MLQLPTMVERGSRQLGRFVCGERVGMGPVGAVHRARVFGEAGFAKDFALTVVEDAIARDRLALARLVRAANAWAQLSHPRIAKAHEFSVENEGHGETYFVVADWRRGASLRAILQDGPLPADAALALVADVADTVAHAHARVELVTGGVLHLGLSPDSLYVDGDGILQVRDFCITQARVAAGWAEDDRLAPALRYAAPELQSGNPVDLRADIFALGAVLFELFTARHAFDGMRARDVAARVRSTPPALDGVPASAGPLVARTLALNPGARLPTMTALRDQALALVGNRIAAAREQLAERARKRQPGEVPLPPTLTAPTEAELAEARAADKGDRNEARPAVALDDLLSSLPPLVPPDDPAPLPPIPMSASPIDMTTSASSRHFVPSEPSSSRHFVPLGRQSVWDPPQTTATLSLEALRRSRPRRWLRLGVPLALLASGAGAAGLYRRVESARARIHDAEQLTVARQALPAPPPSLLLTSLPPGARVFLDGQPRGTTPVKLGLPRGLHTVALVADNYRLFRATEDITDEQAKLDVRLDPAELPDTLAGDAGLKVACKGDRRLFVDGVDTGRACPVEERIPVAPGPHTLSLYEPLGDKKIAIERPITVKDRGSSTRIILDE
jgi:hypothetical protein